MITSFKLDSLNRDDEISTPETNRYSNDYDSDDDNRDVAFRLVKDDAQKRKKRKGNG